MLLQKLPTATCDGLLCKPEELVGQLAIREATAEVVSCSCLAGTRRLSLWWPLAMAPLRYNGSKPF